MDTINDAERLAEGWRQGRTRERQSYFELFRTAVALGNEHLASTAFAEFQRLGDELLADQRICEPFTTPPARSEADRQFAELWQDARLSVEEIGHRFGHGYHWAYNRAYALNLGRRPHRRLAA